MLIINVLSAMVYIAHLLSDKGHPRIVTYSVGFDSFGLIWAISVVVWTIKCLSLL
jgi:hypothetical protein